MSHEQDLNRLDRAIQELRIEHERFFNGAIQVPPEDLQTRIQREIRRLRNEQLQGAADQFRLNSLEARFNSFNERFNRRLREHEEGRGARAKETPGSRGPDPRQGVVIGEEADGAAVEALYTGLQQRSGKGPKFDLDSFERYLQRQASNIRQKTGCREVQFRLSEEGGKLKLKAKPVRPEA